MWNPFKMLRTKDWLKLQAQDSSFYILVIQDHIESIGKANTIKEGPPEGKEHRHPEMYYEGVLPGAHLIGDECLKDVIFE